MMTPETQRIFDEVTNKRIALLAEIIRDGNEMSATCATYLLSLIPTKSAAEMMLTLIEEMDGDIGMMHALASAFITHSPFRNELRPRLEEIFAKEIDDLAGLYDQLHEFDPRLLEMPDRAEEIATALEADFDRRLTAETQSPHCANQGGLIKLRY